MLKNKSRKFIILGLAIFIVNFSGVSIAHAESAVRINNEISVTENEDIPGDFYPAGVKINISGTVKDDLNAIGGQITINGSVGNDALLVAPKVDVHGTVGDDLRIVGYDVTIAEPVTGDVFVIGGDVAILSTASISGDLIIFGGNASIEGSVGGDVLGTISNLRVDAAVAGDLDITVNELTLGDKANIAGSVHYVSDKVATKALNSTVGGEMLRNDPIIPVNNVTLNSALFPVSVLIFSTLVWYLLSRKSLRLVVERAVVRSPRPIILGLIFIFFTPVAISILVASVIGSLVGLISFFAYLLIVLLSIVCLPATLGRVMMKIFNQPLQHLSLLSVVVGTVGVFLLLLLPIVGQIVLIMLLVINIGACVDLLIRPTLK